MVKLLLKLFCCLRIAASSPDTLRGTGRARCERPGVVAPVLVSVFWFRVLPAELIQEEKSSSLSPLAYLLGSVTGDGPKFSADVKAGGEDFVLLSKKLWMKSSSVVFRAKPPNCSICAACSAKEPGADCREGCAVALKASEKAGE